MATYPSGVQFTTVVGEFSRNVDNIAGMIPASGTITFTPNVSVLRGVGATTFTAIQAQTVVTLVNGQIVDALSGLPGVQIIASDSLSIEPRDFTYKVSLNFTHLQGVFEFNFFAPANTIIDLTTVLPVNPSSGVYIGADAILAAINTDVADAQLAADRAELAARRAEATVGNQNGEIDVVMSIGTVETGEAGSLASATVVEPTPNNFLLNLRIPRGNQGLQGERGPQGPAGSGTGGGGGNSILIMGYNQLMPAGSAPTLILRTSDSSGGTGTTVPLSPSVELSSTAPLPTDNTNYLVIRKG